MVLSKTIPDLRRAVKGLSRDEWLVPALMSALNDPHFSGFNVEIEPWTSRPPDGYFHPSTQSTWTIRQLALYLIAPHLVEQERMQVTGVFAITQGHFWHMFIQHVLKEEGILLKDEIGFTDEEHRRRGHMDGLLEIKGETEGLEIKTINPFKIKGISNEAELREKKPGYWAQAQEYLDVFNLPRMRFLFISPSYPFPMNEFTVNANPEHQARRRELYKGAIEIASQGRLPLPQGGCCHKPETCALRKACQYVG